MKIELVDPQKHINLKSGQGYLNFLNDAGTRKRILWYCCHHCKGTILASDHTITEHDDGTITLEPSLVCPTENCSGHFFIKKNEVTEA